MHTRKSLETAIILLLRPTAAKDPTVQISLVEIEAAIYFEPIEETPTAHLQHQIGFLNLG